MMNDFTKEELQVMLTIYENLTIGTVIEGMGRTIIKIQSMIDNYCKRDAFIKENRNSIRQICEICGTWMDKEWEIHYVNPCNDGGHEWTVFAK